MKKLTYLALAAALAFSAVGAPALARASPELTLTQVAANDRDHNRRDNHDQFRNNRDHRQDNNRNQ